jgi:hypothetical protein
VITLFGLAVSQVQAINAENQPHPNAVDKDQQLETTLKAAETTLYCPSDAFFFDGYCYAAMDRCPFYISAGICPSSCQINGIALPEGWEPAPEEKSIIAVMVQYSFGTSKLVFGSTAYFTTVVDESGDIANTGVLVVSEDGLYITLDCDSKVIMRIRASDVPFPEPTPESTATPVPTWTPEPTSTWAPTWTPEPTWAPTWTPEPTPTSQRCQDADNSLTCSMMAELGRCGKTVLIGDGRRLSVRNICPLSCGCQSFDGECVCDDDIGLRKFARSYGIDAWVISCEQILAFVPCDFGFAGVSPRTFCHSSCPSEASVPI